MKLELKRDLVTILSTEAQNQRTPPIDYVIAEDGGRMVHRTEPDIAMAELLEEAATALASERAAHAETKARLAEALKALDGLLKPFEGDDCRYDHHGYCQAHFLQEVDECCVKIARRVREGGKVDG